MSKAESEQLRQEEFNRWARNGRGEQMERAHRHQAREAILSLALQPGERVLDLGCGVGWATRLLAEAVAGEQGIAAGLDLSQEMVARARAGCREVENALFAIGSAEEIPWRDEYFQKALCLESFYLFPDQKAVLRELRRVLAPGGRLAIALSLYRENPHALGWVERMGVPVQVRSSAEYEQMLRAEGFADVAVKSLPDSDAPSQCYNEAYPDGWFAEEAQFREFRRVGALLVAARKP